MRSNEAVKAFRSRFEREAYKVSYAELFSDFLDFALWAMNPLNENRDQEAQHLEQKYGREHAEGFAELFKLWSMAADNDGEGFADPLGDLFMELVSHGRNGQYFTPEPICRMKALMICPDLKDGQTVHDPACGSGRTLLAAGQINRNAIFYGADIDAVCCKMAVLNMLVNSMTGEIAHMDTLRMEHYKSWHLRKVLQPNGYYLPYFFTSGAGQSAIFTHAVKEAQKPPEIRDAPNVPNGQQMSLF